MLRVGGLRLRPSPSVSSFLVRCRNLEDRGREEGIINTNKKKVLFSNPSFRKINFLCSFLTRDGGGGVNVCGNSEKKLTLCDKCYVRGIDYLGEFDGLRSIIEWFGIM